MGAEPPAGDSFVAGPAAPRYLAQRYRLDRVLGRGAMGRVWAGHDEALNRWVAIKEVDPPPGLPRAEAALASQRAMREARAIASVSDPHVVTIFDLLTDGGHPVIVMELLDARSLTDVLGQDGGIDVVSAAVVGVGVAAGLLAAHAAGVTHRDVKPGNVLLCRDGRVKLTDFGIARSVGENTLTATGLLLGSPAYISPEVAAGAVATPASDAWGLGAMLYACVQGEPPFDRGDPFRTLAAVVNSPVPPHHRSGELGPVIDGLLVKDPSRRMGIAQAHAQLLGIAGDHAGQRLAHRYFPGGRNRAVPGAPVAAARPVAAGPATRPQPAVPGAAAPARAGGFAQPAPSAPLPPPPWAGRATQALAPLPARAPRLSPSVRWVAAPLVALAAAAAGFFGVTAIGHLTGPAAPTGTPTPFAPASTP